MVSILAYSETNWAALPKPTRRCVNRKLTVLLMPPWDSDTWIVPELPAMSLQHASSWRRLAITGLLATLTIAGFSCDGAEARTTHHHPQAVHQVADKRVVHGPKYHPPYSAIVIDNNSGQVLHDENADDLRHPASLTKIMTLYLLFEQLEAGSLKLKRSCGSRPSLLCNRQRNLASRPIRRSRSRTR